MNKTAMEKIFGLSVNEFKTRMKSISEEAFEAYADSLIEEKMPSDNSLSFDLLCIVFAYCRKEYREKADFVRMLKLLQAVVSTGELIYMQTDGTEEMVRRAKSDLKENRQYVNNMAALAGMILEYYFRVFERGSFPQTRHREIKKALRALLLESSLDIVKMKKYNKPEEKPLPVCIKEHLEDTMVGQVDAKKTIALVMDDFLNHGERSVVLVEGPTGVGKSFLFKNLSEFEVLKENLTFFSYTATQLTPNGFSGDNVEDLFKEYRKACERRCSSNFVRPTHKGVIFIDEFDKLLRPNFDSAGEDVNAIIVSQLLTYIDGTSSVSGIDTKDIMFILAGAFEDMAIFREEEKNRRPMGFVNSERTTAEEELAEDGGKTYDLEAELRKKNTSRELLGRITHIVHMDSIDRNAMREILVNPGSGVLTLWKKRFEDSGLSLIIENDEVVEGILDRAMDKNVGARGIRKIVESMIGMYRYDMLEKGYKVMILHKGMLDEEPPKFREDNVYDSFVRINKGRAGRDE